MNAAAKLLPDWAGLHSHPKAPNPLSVPLKLRPSLSARCESRFPHSRPPFRRKSVAAAAGRSKKKPGGPSPGRIEGGADVRRRAKQAARKRSRRMAENLVYRHSKTWSEEADSFTEEELQMIGLGYDRTVRFMDKDDPRLRHPHDWYKYGQFGPYSWRGVVVGSPIRGRFSDERVALIGEVNDHKEFELIDQHEMGVDFSPRSGSRYYWVFVRHPKWRSTDPPWQQWTLVAEIAVEDAENRPIDKWTLMGRLGNNTRALISQCAAWRRPDIIYVRRPIYHCRFEPQEDFFRLLVPLLDPATEDQFLCELRRADGSVETCTYFAGLCKIVGMGTKAFVDDVVEAFQRLSEEGKDRCLEFLLRNHPLELLHPYTKEWKAKLEGDDDDDDDDNDNSLVDADDGEDEFLDSVIEVEDDYDDNDDDEDDDNDDDEELVVDEDEEDDQDVEAESSPEYWEEQWEKAMREPEAMEGLVQKSIEVSNQVYEKQRLEEEEAMEGPSGFSPAAPAEMVDVKADYGGRRGTRRRTRIPPELFLRAAVRPFTYRNLVKEIVLLRHAIVDNEIV
ncbi:uncharacterized protein LOC144711823 [Wolffia australiana]